MAKKKRVPSYVADMRAGSRPVKRAFSLPLGRKKEAPEKSDPEQVEEETELPAYNPENYEDSGPEAISTPEPEDAVEEEQLPQDTETEVAGPETSEDATQATAAWPLGGLRHEKSNKGEKESKEAEALSEDTKSAVEPANDGMPQFLRSANSTIRRDGPYQNYSGSADVLRYKRKEGDNRRGRGRRSRKKQRRDEVVSFEAISVVALVIILGTVFFCAIRHVEMHELSLAALLVTIIITILMGFFLREAPAYVTLILVAMIIIAGAVTGMFSEVITGSVIFLGTVAAIKGRLE